MKYKNILSLTLTCIMLMLCMNVGATSLGQMTLSQAKLPIGTTFYKGNPRALLTQNFSQTDVKQWLLDFGLLNADTYMLTYQEANAMKYGIVADVFLGTRGLVNLGLVSNTSEYDNIQVLAEAINNNSYNRVVPYILLKPMVKQHGVYTGTLQITSFRDSIAYQEIIHVILYEDKYAGLVARLIVFDATNDRELWQKFEPIFRIEK